MQGRFLKSLDTGPLLSLADKSPWSEPWEVALLLQAFDCLVDGLFPERQHANAKESFHFLSLFLLFTRSANSSFFKLLLPPFPGFPLGPQQFGALVVRQPRLIKSLEMHQIQLAESLLTVLCRAGC